MNDAGGSSPYDEVFYPSYSHTNSHPDRMATQAMLWGVNPAPVAACRVLELGCGDGSNLVPMAYSLPGSRFLGVDLSARAVTRGRDMIRDLGLTNVELRHGDIMDVNESWGEFDYIIAHGVFSWVPPKVRDKIIAICRENLAPQGVAFISYLTYPGSYVRAMLRDMMLYRAAGQKADPEKMLAAAREMASFIANSAPGGDFVQQALRGEAARIVKEPPNYLFHDDLAECNAPYYFVQFAGVAAANGLQFLAEADPVEMGDMHLSQAVRDELERLAPERVEHEQYVDFLKGRRFRQTLLCRAGIQVSDTSALERVPEMWVASPASGPVEIVDLSPATEVTYISPRGPKLETALPMAKAAMPLLVQSWPRRIPFREVTGVVRSRLAQAGLPVPDAGDLDLELAQFLLHLTAAGIIEFHTESTSQVATLSERPVASAVARWQAARGSWITTLRHVGLTFIDDLTVHFIPLLDGTRTRDDVISEILASSPRAKDGGILAENDIVERLQRLALEGILIG